MRFIEKKNHIYDTQYQEYLCLLDDSSCKSTIKRLNELNNNYLILGDNYAELQEKLVECEEKYNHILELIDIKIRENKQLAFLHFPEPGDEYVNEYESRAYELEQLKELILNGK